MREALHIMKHALGLNRSRVSYRNYFAADERTEDCQTCRELTDMGLMEEHPRKHKDDLILFTVTDEGIEYVRTETE